MKRLGGILNTKMPDGCGCLVNVLGLLIVGIVIIDTVSVIEPARELRERSKGAVAIVDKRRITESDLAEALRATQWRSASEWISLSLKQRQQLRESVLRELIDKWVLASLKTQGTATMARSANNSFQQFLKQFEGDEWKQRAAWQGLNEASLRQQIGEETAASEALEQELTKRAPAVSDEMIRGWYDSHREKLMNPERVHASHIFLTRHDKANPDRAAEMAEIHRKLLTHEATFEELAARHSDDERSNRVGGDLGWFSRGRVPQDFGDKVFALVVGQVSDVFETKLGWHIAVVKEKRAAEPLTFEQAKPEIEALLMDERRRNALGALLSELRQKAHIERFEDRIAKVEPAP